MTLGVCVPQLFFPWTALTFVEQQDFPESKTLGAVAGHNFLPGPNITKQQLNLEDVGTKRV